MSLYGKIGEMSYELLLADPDNAEKIAIPCEPGNGIVKRGTIMVRKAATGLWAPAVTGDITTSNQLVVLDETVDTTGVASGNKTIAEDAAAYRSGCFVRGKVTLKNDAAVTAAHEVVLRLQNIVFEPVNGSAVFDNTVTG